MHLSSFIAPSVVAALSVNLAAQAAPAPQLLPLSLSEPLSAHDATQRVFGLSSTFSEPQHDSDDSPLDDAPSDFVDVLLSEASLAVEDAASKEVHQKDGPSPGGWVWKSCGEETDAVEVKSIEVSPDPPKPGQNLTVTASGIVKSRIEVSAMDGYPHLLGILRGVCLSCLESVRRMAGSRSAFLSQFSEGALRTLLSSSP